MEAFLEVDPKLGRGGTEGKLEGNASFFQTLIVPRIKILCLAACLANQSCVDSNSKCILAFLFLPYCKNCLRLET